MSRRIVGPGITGHLADHNEINAALRAQQRRLEQIECVQAAWMNLAVAAVFLAGLAGWTYAVEVFEHRYLTSLAGAAGLFCAFMFARCLIGAVVAVRDFRRLS